MKERILLFGGAGRLGQELVSLAAETKLMAPRSHDIDIRDKDSIFKLIKTFSPDIIINLAAIVGAQECEKDKARAWAVNALGAQNIASVARERQLRYIYVSTNSVFDGEKGNYVENDTPNPTYYYAMTKLAGEQSAGVVENHAVVRVDFFPRQEPKYRKVFIDHYTSKIPASLAARKILTVSLSDYKGIIHIGQERASLYDIMSKHFEGLEPITIAESSLPNFPRDLSFNLNQWRESYGDC